jgi:CheY-like chemotaxis protein
MESAMTESLGRLLLVDDETPVLEVLSEYFSTQGYAVQTAGTGADALAAARHSRPDLVLLDIRMPGMDGVEVLKKLRDFDPSLAVIMVTANEDMALARETLKIGAFDYVSKPFDFRYLDRAVSAALVQGGALAPVGTEEASTDSLRGLAFQVFHATRGLPPVARESVGMRLETAVLELMREASAGRSMTAEAALTEVELLTAIAADLGDLPEAVQSTLESALASARKALSHV